MPSLTKAEKAKESVAFASIIVALLLQRTLEKAGLPTDSPAVQQCTALSSETLDSMGLEAKHVAIANINKRRVSLTSKTEDCDLLSSLVGAVEVFTSPLFKAKIGTRFDYVRRTLDSSLTGLRQLAIVRDADRHKFAAQFKQHILGK